jgi:hypothetical protein
MRVNDVRPLATEDAIQRRDQTPVVSPLPACQPGQRNVRGEWHVVTGTATADGEREPGSIRPVGEFCHAKFGAAESESQDQVKNTNGPSVKGCGDHDDSLRFNAEHAGQPRRPEQTVGHCDARRQDAAAAIRSTRSSVPR